MRESGRRLKEIYGKLHSHFGPQHWWPGDSPFEIILGAILTQNTAWSNVETALNNIRKADLLNPVKLHETDTDVLAFMIKPSGYYNQKAKKIKNFLNYFMENYGGDIRRLKSADMESLREELLSIKGIGLETADSILLYALEKPAFVVDTYTYRILLRHNFIFEDASYQEIQELFLSNLEENIQLFNEFHALFVACGKEFCKKRAPLCGNCPLQYDLES